MNARTTSILNHFDSIQQWRRLQAADEALAAKIVEVKRYQRRRFERTYADWIANPRAARACRFFLEELYGDRDFSRRDAEFRRVIPAMTKLFPDELVGTIDALASLHALSESFDHSMATALSKTVLDATNYIAAWQRTGEQPLRQRQIALMSEVGGALAIHTRKPMLKRMLKFMRAPAAAAGLGSLQAFLEEGFESFASLTDPEVFLRSVHTREMALCERLFEIDAAVQWQSLASSPTRANDPLGQLP